MGKYAAFIGQQISDELLDLLDRPDCKRARAETAKFLRTLALRHENDPTPLNLRMADIEPPIREIDIQPRRKPWTYYLLSAPARLTYAFCALVIAATIFAGFIHGVSESSALRAKEAVNPPMTTAPALMTPWPETEYFAPGPEGE